MKLPKTAVMMIAAAVTTRALPRKPETTDRFAPPSCTELSRMRETRKTS